MKKIFCVFLLQFSSHLSALQVKPWLGNWLEFEASLFQKHTESTEVATNSGTKLHSLHSEATMANLGVTILPTLSAEFELDLAKTQSHDYGFQAIKTSLRKGWLNDLGGDPVSLMTALTCSFSTPSRIKDLSATEHAVFEGDFRLSFGREFGYTEEGLYRLWAMCLVGAGSSGSPWLGGEVHFEKTFSDEHTLDLFMLVQKGLSSRRLTAVSNFHSYSRLAYEYEDAGIKYAYSQFPYGSFYVQYAKRLHARYCPKASWSIELGFMIPFSPW